MIRLTFTANTFKEIREEVMQAAGDMLKFGLVTTPTGVAGQVRNDAPLVPAGAAAPSDLNPPQGGPVEPPPQPAEPKHRSYKKKTTDTIMDAQTAAKAGINADAEKAELIPPRQSLAATKDQLITALNSVFESHGIDAARECLTKHGVAKVQELKVDQYESFLKTCAEAEAKPAAT